MRESKFFIYGYAFSSYRNSLEKALNEYGISYKINNNTIYFETYFEDETQEWYAEFKRNKITTLFFYCKSKNNSSSIAIRKQLENNYWCANRDVIAKVEYYESYLDKNISISVETMQTFRMIITFKFANRFSYRGIVEKNSFASNIAETVFWVVTIFIGLALSITGYLLYNLVNLEWLNILMAVISALFMTISVLFLCLISDWTIKTSIIFSIILPILYWVIVFLILLFICKGQIPDFGDRAIMSVYFAFYAMPAYVIVILVALLCLAGLSYA